MDEALPRGLHPDANLLGRTAAFFVSGPLPGQNEIIALHNAYRAKSARGKMRNAYVAEKKKQTQRIAELALAAKVPKMVRAYFVMEWFEAKRNRNPDNIAAAIKFVLDGLVTARVLVNDGWSEIAGWENHFRVVRPGQKQGVWVTLREVPPLPGR